MNSRIQAILSKLSELVSSLGDKQDKLTAGDNVTIGEDNVISAKGGVEVVDTDNDVIYPLNLKLIDGKPVIEIETTTGGNENE